MVLCFSLFLALSAVPAARAEDAPLLRVLLRRLDIGNRIGLDTDGQYLLEGGNGIRILLSRDTSLSVELREKDLVLFLSGASLSLGPSAKLTRLDDGGSSPSLKISGASGSYPGDLALSVQDEKIQAVLSLALEDYLLGVVPNEMSDGFPLEALKAQAVCARTYALRKMGGSGEWDVVDTTNDQVFRGISDANQNAAQAVAETSRLVLKKDGKLIECYYSASNGGQTELPENVWGGTGYTGCYVMKDDPGIRPIRTA